MNHLMPSLYNMLFIFATIVASVTVVVLVYLLRKRNASIRFSLLKILTIDIQLKEGDQD